MSDFIQGDNFDRPGGKSEEIVWNRVKDALKQRDILGYSRYPLFSEIGERRKEPDILLLDKELGIIIIEVKGFTISNIKNIDPNNWIMEEFYQKTINPIAQAEDYLYSVKSKFDRERILRNKVRGQYFVALPEITKNQWSERGFNKIIDDKYIILKEDLTKAALTKKILNQPSLNGGKKLDNECYKIAKAILGHENNHVVSDMDSFCKEGTKGSIYSHVKNKLHDLDIQQENIAKVIAPGPQRIRGIAGSGKTVLICQKAAIMHLRHPDWKIVVVFFTQSLYENVISTIDMYIKAFSDGQISYDEDSNLKVLHAWGSKKKDGFYREVCNRNDCEFMSAGNVKEEVGYLEFNNSINYICKKLLEETQGNLEQIYDAILIDEGQDLVGDEQYKYDNKQSFYYMAYKSLKPIDGEDNKLKRLVWAYDELQSLNDKKIPSSAEIFGDNTLVIGKYKGGINKSEVMKKCYRTPHQILTTAHAVGMGFFRQDGLVSGYTRKDEWENIGYKVLKGDFRKLGSEIILKRPIENSVNPINEYYKGNTVQLNTFNSQNDMLKDLAINIKKDIEKEGLKPSRDILVLTLYDSYNYKTIEEQIGKYLNDEGINFYIPSMSQKNEYSCHWKYRKPDLFWVEGAVTLTQIGRAKGNEAPMVYVVGLEVIGKDESSVKQRNKLFTAMTRAKCWVNLMGVGSYTLYEEIQKAISCNGEFKFKFSKPKKETNDIIEENMKYSPSLT